MNCNNANKELGFDKFSKCDYNLHWSFSNFNRILMAAGQIAQLPYNSKVLELGAGSSDLENIVKRNFKRSDIEFFKIDGDKQYECNEHIKVFDVMSQACADFCKLHGQFDAIVFMEVIEHLKKTDAPIIIEKISNWLKSEGLMLFTTPTPPIEGNYENRVWPTDHEFEFTFSEIHGIINKWFKINKRIGWSLEEREYNDLLESDAGLSLIYSKLRGAFPESYIRAIIACLSPVETNRQIFLVCKKRRVANGRFTQA